MCASIETFQRCGARSAFETKRGDSDDAEILDSLGAAARQCAASGVVVLHTTPGDLAELASQR